MMTKSNTRIEEKFSSKIKKWKSRKEKMYIMRSISNITSQIIAVRSFDAEAKYFPLCENCTNQTSSSCASNICCNIRKKRK